MNFGTLGTGFGGMGRGGPNTPYVFSNAEASAVVAAFSVEPDSGRKQLIDILVGALKTAGVWSKLDLLYLLAAHDSQAGLINWITPASFTLLNVNSVSFTVDRGYTGNGTSSYLRTQYTPNTHKVNLALDSAAIGLYSRTNAVNTAPPLGARTTSTTGQLFFTPRGTGDNASYRVNQDAVGSNVTVTDSSGHFLVQRTASNAREIFRNDVSAGTENTVSTSIPTVEFALCGLNTAGTVSIFNNYQLSFAYVGASLSAGQRTALHNALAAYGTSVGFFLG